MNRPAMRLRDPGGVAEYPWNRPFRRAVRDLPIGRMDIRVLEQRKVWVDSASRVHAIADLSGDHLENVVAMLRKTAVELFLDYSVAAELGRFRPRRKPSPVVGDVRAPAHRWLTTTPLWQALHWELAMRMQRRCDMPQRLDAAYGVSAVRTEDATYVLDVGGARMLVVTTSGDPRGANLYWEPAPAWAPVRVAYPLRVESTGRAFPRRRSGVDVARVVVSIHPLLIEPNSSVANVATLARLVTRLSSRLRPDYLETRYRTRHFLDAVGDVRALWAALDLLMERHGVSRADLVPTRLRDARAPEHGVDLLAHDITSPERDLFQAAVDAALGRHLPVTTLDNYPLLTPAEVAEHAAELGPGV